MRQFLGIFLCLSLMACPVSAQDPDLKSLDENSDGKISVAEFEGYAEERLPGFEQLELFAQKVDANSDGEISGDEFAGRMEILGKFQSGEFDEMEAAEEPQSETPNSSEKPKTVSASKDKSGATDTFNKIKALIKKDDWQSASKLMTTEAADQAAAQIVTSGLAMVEIELPIPMPKLDDAIDDVDAVLGKHGLDKLGIQTEAMLKIKIGGPDDDEEESPAKSEADEKAKAKRKSNTGKIITALDKDGKRWQIIGELSKAMSSSPFGFSPLSAKAGTVTIEGDHAILEVKAVPPQHDDDPGVMIKVMSPPMFLDFQKSNGQWKYAGINRKKTDQALKEFSANMHGMGEDEDDD